MSNAELTTTSDAVKRRPRKTFVGLVHADKMQKTISVKIERSVAHPIYGKIVRRFTTLKVHDENNEAKPGDVVEVMECRPLSKTKRFRLVRVVTRAATSS